MKNIFIKNYKKLFVFSLIFLITSTLFAANAKFQSDDYQIEVSYNDEIVPGDAIFVRLNIIFPKNHKRNKNEPEKKAALELYQDKKLIESSPFYSISKKKTSNQEYLSGIPISSWLTENNYSLKVVYDFSESDSYKEFFLPVSFKSKTFDQEDIELDIKNTEIKTDNSPERMAQIEKLNNILFTTINTDVYSLKKFVSPTTSTRYTAHFGDRRKYLYSNGKSSTNLHYGNDYGIPTGSSVTACSDGKVVMAETRITTGYSVVIEHLPGLYSLYYHLSSTQVKEGDFVKQGDLIGLSGATGLATGPHLHWEVRLNGAAVRPEFFCNDFSFEE